MTDESEIKEIIEGHQRRNLELLSVLSTKGVQLDAIRAIDLHFWSFTQRDAAFLARELYRENLLIMSIEPAEKDEKKAWSIEAQAALSPENAASLECIETHTHLAAKFDSIFDGWGTRIGKQETKSAKSEIG